MENSFPRIKSTISTTTDLTKINIIVTTIPEPTLFAINLTFLSLGVSLSFLLIIVIALKPSMRTSTNCYIVSLVCSSLIMLFEAFQKVFRRLFDTNIKMNMDYVCLVSFDVSIMTIAMMHIEMYITFCHRNLPIARFLMKIKTTVKAVLLIWCIGTINIAIELHIYDYFEGVMDEIYAWSTFLFVVLPAIIFFILDIFTFYELIILKAIEGSWKSKELRIFLMIVTFTVGFYLTMVPYRLARAISFVVPKAPCCIASRREILYLIAKTFPIILPIIYIVASTEFRKTLQKMLRCQDEKTEEVSPPNDC